MDLLSSQETMWKGARGYGYKLHCERFHLNRRKFYTVRIIHWNYFPRNEVESSPLQVLKMQLNKVLNNLI